MTWQIVWLVLQLIIVLANVGGGLIGVSRRKISLSDAFGRVLGVLAMVVTNNVILYLGGFFKVFFS